MGGVTVLDSGGGCSVEQFVSCCGLGFRFVAMQNLFFFSSRRRHTRCALVTGVQTCALPISPVSRVLLARLPAPDEAPRAQRVRSGILVGARRQGARARAGPRTRAG